MGVKKRTRLLAFVFLCMICVCACSKKVEKDGNRVGGTITETPSILATPTTEIEHTIEELNEFKELSIYTIDGETAQKVAITAVVSADKEITPQLILDKVVESMADQAFMIGIDSVTTQDDTIIVSFLDNQPPVMNVGSSVEGEILDAIAQSLLDSLEDEYHKVIYRVMGEAYVSGHFAFDIDDVYLESQ